MRQDLQVGWDHSEPKGSQGQFCSMNLILRLRMKREQLLGGRPSHDGGRSFQKYKQKQASLNCHFKNVEANSVRCEKAIKQQ